MDMSNMSGMSMTTTMASAATSTMDMSSMASSTSSSMDMSSSSMMGMDSMAMTFFTSTTTPLFSMAWTPASTGQYAGTCIFLIAFATIFRALLAIRVNFFEFMGAVKRRRNDGQLKPYGVACSTNIRPWRVSEAVMLASMDVILAGIGYLLMIAVMTMNVGYFMSILAGVFLGGMIFSRFMIHSAGH